MDMVSRSEKSQSATSSHDADIRSHGKQSCANPSTAGDLKYVFVTDPESDQAYRAMLEVKHFEFQGDDCSPSY